MNTRFNALAFLLFAVVYGAQAQDNHLKIHFDFSQISGNGVTDIAGGINARLMGAARVEQVAALNFGGVDGASLPWITYNYADCWAPLGTHPKWEKVRQITLLFSVELNFPTLFFSTTN